MRRIGIISTCFATVLAFAAISVAGASATELLSSAATATIKGTGGEIKLFGASEVKCSTSTATAEFSDAHLGILVLLLEVCKVGSIVCTGSTDTISGHITVIGEFHLNLGRSSAGGEPHATVLNLIPVGKSVVFKCGILGTVEVKGSVAGLLFKKDGTRLIAGENFLGAKMVFGSGKSTKQEDQEFLLALTTPENVVMTGQRLETNIFGGGFKEAGIEGEAEVTQASVAGMHLVTG